MKMPRANPAPLAASPGDTAADVPLFGAAGALVRRDMALAWRHRGDLLTAVSFFAVIVLLFPLASGAERKLLEAMAPGVLWIAALLAHVLSAQRIFHDDARDGTLEQWLAAPQPLPMLVAARMTSNWIVTSLPLIVLGPLLMLPFDLPPDASAMLSLSLLVGTPAMTAIGITAAAMTLRLRQGAGLLALLVFPLEVPVLVFGTGAVAAVMGGMPASAHLSLLGAFSLLAVPGAAMATAVALRIAND